MARLLANSSACSGCKICELICSYWHEGEFNPAKARIRVEINRSIEPVTSPREIDVPHVCRQCDPAPCAEVCSQETIARNQETNAWDVRLDECTGCGLCVEECPHNMILLNRKTEKAQKCDLCGGEPQCVFFCPREALKLSED